MNANRLIYKLRKQTNINNFKLEYNNLGPNGYWYIFDEKTTCDVIIGHTLSQKEFDISIQELTAAIKDYI